MYIYTFPVLFIGKYIKQQQQQIDCKTQVLLFTLRIVITYAITYS